MHWALDIAGLTALVAIAGCSTATPAVQRHTGDIRTETRAHRPTGQTVAWSVFIDDLSGADIVVLGEQHDDAIGHAVQRAVVEDLLAPGQGAVALEMLERDEQMLIEDYRDGVIDAATFAELTDSVSWAGPGSWSAWYQPVIDAAIERGAGVVAANAPRRYVRLARTQGWDRLQGLDPARRQLVQHPSPEITGDYRDRFMDLMGGHGDDVDTERLESFFRAQQVWDATMAASTAQALGTYGRPVILLVGRFHSDAQGGTVTQLQQRLPAARIVTVSLEPWVTEVDWDATPHQADWVIDTGH